MDLSSPTLSAIRRTSAVDTVRARISLAVELGMLSPGQRLPPPEETARAFEVSEMTVRRAYRALGDEGLVVRRRGNSGGTFIADIPAEGTVPALAEYRADAAHVHGLIDQRAALEAGLAAIAAAGVTSGGTGGSGGSGDTAGTGAGGAGGTGGFGGTTDSADSPPRGAADRAGWLARLDDLVETMRTVPDWAGFREADAAFHAELAAAAAVPGAADLHHRVAHELYAYFIPYRIDYLRASNDEHVLLVAALRVGDAAEASRLAFAHVAELHESMYVGLSLG
jgi:DNA-binding FadR family transcriptional regulator